MAEGDIEKHAGGRPPVITPEIIHKLEEVFMIGGTDLEACLYADISKSALYNYQQLHPEFVERKEQLKARPILKARQTIIAGLSDPDTAKWYLERKMKKEFAPRQEQTGAEGEPLRIQVVAYRPDANETSTSEAKDIRPPYLPEAPGRSSVASEAVPEASQVGGEASGEVRPGEERVPAAPEAGGAQ